MKKSIIVLVLSVLYYFSFSQEITVNGIVKDAKTNNPVIGAAVFELGDATIGTATDTEGFFSLKFSKKHIILKVAYIGYKDTVFDFYLVKDTALIVNLVSETDIDEVKIEDDSINWRPADNDLSGNIKLILAEGADKKDKFTIKKIPVKKEKKAEKKINEIFLSSIDNPAGKAVYIDGARIYFPVVDFWLMPLIPENVADNFDYYEINFPAKYGNFPAPVFDVDIKKGDMKRYRGNVTASFFGAGFNFTGPVKEERSAFFVSARKSFINSPYTELFLTDNTETGEYRLKSNFWDINLKYSHNLTENSKFFISFFHNKNKSETGTGEVNSDTAEYSITRNINPIYGNTAAVFNFSHSFTQDFIFNAALIYSRYNLNQTITGDSVGMSDNKISYINRYDAEYVSGNSDFGLKLSAKYNINNEHFLLFGANAFNKRFRPVDASLSVNDFENSFEIDTTWQANTINAQEYSLFAQDSYKPDENITVNGGLRFSAFSNENKTYYSVEPRIFGSYRVLDFLSAEISYAYNKDYLHMLTGNYVGLSSVIFIPSSENILPTVTNHFAAGAVLNLPFDINLKGTVFYDNIKDAYEYKDNYSYFDYPGKPVLTGTDIESRITEVSGSYKGVRTSVTKKYKGFKLSLNHIISDYSLNSDSINFGQSFQYTKNRKNEIGLKVSYSVNENIGIFANWTYQSGNFVTLRKQHYVPYDYTTGNLGTGNIPDMSTMYLNEYVQIPPFNRNDFKLPAYHRLDIGADYTVENHKIGLHIYNVYNRRNPEFIDYKKGTLTNETLNRVVKYTDLPFFPTISYSYRFEY